MDMTVCIGLICDSKKRAIVIADRMITQEGISVQFEHTESKIKKLAPNCLALVSGSATICEDIFEPVISRFKRLKNVRISKIASEVAASYSQIRSKKIEEIHFRPRQLTMKWFYENQKKLNDGYIRSMDATIEEFTFDEGSDFDVLVVGVDKDGAHIYTINNPGTGNTLDGIGWGCAGNGFLHAESTIIANKYSSKMPFKKALYIAYCAKRHAEIAPGVGNNDTDIAYITEKGQCNFLSDKNKEHLKRLYDEMDIYRIQKEEEISRKLEKLIL